MSVGDGEPPRGPWNQEPTFDFRGGRARRSTAAAACRRSISTPSDVALVKKAAERLRSDPASDPVTGAMLGMDGMSAANSAAGGSAPPLTEQTLQPQAAKENAQKQAQSGSNEPPKAKSEVQVLSHGRQLAETALRRVFGPGPPARRSARLLRPACARPARR